MQRRVQLLFQSVPECGHPQNSCCASPVRLCSSRVSSPEGQLLRAVVHSAPGVGSSVSSLPSRSVPAEFKSGPARVLFRSASSADHEAAGAQETMAAAMPG